MPDHPAAVSVAALSSAQLAALLNSRPTAASHELSSSRPHTTDHQTVIQPASRLQTPAGAPLRVDDSTLISFTPNVTRPVTSAVSELPVMIAANDSTSTSRQHERANNSRRNSHQFLPPLNHQQGTPSNEIVISPLRPSTDSRTAISVGPSSSSPNQPIYRGTADMSIAPSNAAFLDAAHIANSPTIPTRRDLSFESHVPMHHTGEIVHRPIATPSRLTTGQGRLVGVRPSTAVVPVKSPLASDIAPPNRKRWVLALLPGVSLLVASFIIFFVQAGGYSTLNPGNRDVFLLVGSILHCLGLFGLLLTIGLIIHYRTPFLSGIGVLFQYSLTASMLGTAAFVQSVDSFQSMLKVFDTYMIGVFQLQLVAVFFIFIVFGVWLYSAPERSTEKILTVLDGIDISTLYRDIRTLRGVNAELLTQLQSGGRPISGYNISTPSYGHDRLNRRASIEMATITDEFSTRPISSGPTAPVTPHRSKRRTKKERSTSNFGNSQQMLLPVTPDYGQVGIPSATPSDSNYFMCDERTLQQHRRKR